MKSAVSTVYICDYCGARYCDEATARNHEAVCEKKFELQRKVKANEDMDKKYKELCNLACEFYSKYNVMPNFMLSTPISNDELNGVKIKGQIDNNLTRVAKRAETTVTGNSCSCSEKVETNTKKDTAESKPTNSSPSSATIKIKNLDNLDRLIDILLRD